MTGETRVQKRVVRPQQVEDAPVITHLALDEELGFTLHRLTQVLVKVEESVCVRGDRAHVAQQQPLAEEVVDKRIRARIAQHTRDLLLKIGRLLSSPRAATSSSSSSGMLLHKKNDTRDASSRSLRR